VSFNTTTQLWRLNNSDIIWRTCDGRGRHGAFAGLRSSGLWGVPINDDDDDDDDLHRMVFALVLCSKGMGKCGRAGSQRTNRGQNVRARTMLRLI